MAIKIKEALLEYHFYYVMEGMKWLNSR
jgi:hypothetical protein